MQQKTLFPGRLTLVWGRVSTRAAYHVEICKLIGADIVARIKLFIPDTESAIELSTLNPVTKVALVVAGNEGNLLIKEVAQENNNNVTSRRISGSYD